MKQEKEMERLDNMDGWFGLLIAKIKNSETALEFSFAGQDLQPEEYRLIFKAMEKNKSLKAVVCNRKQLRDDEGIELAKSLMYNTSIERIELESNLLSSKFLTQLAMTLKYNKTLKAIDLEGNYLTNGGDTQGM